MHSAENTGHAEPLCRNLRDWEPEELANVGHPVGRSGDLEATAREREELGHVFARAIDRDWPHPVALSSSLRLKAALAEQVHLDSLYAHALPAMLGFGNA